MEQRRGGATSWGREGGWQPTARAGFRSWLGPHPACFLTRTRGARPRPPPALSLFRSLSPSLSLPLSLSAGRCGAAWGAAMAARFPGPQRHALTPSRLGRKSRLRPPCRPPLGRAPGSRRGLAVLRREPLATSARPKRGTRSRSAETQGRPREAGPESRGWERPGCRRDFRFGTRKWPRRRWWEL